MFLKHEIPKYNPKKKFFSIVELAQFVFGFDGIPTNKYMVQNISNILNININYAKLIGSYVPYERTTEKTRYHSGSFIYSRDIKCGLKTMQYLSTIETDSPRVVTILMHDFDWNISEVVIKVVDYKNYALNKDGTPIVKSFSYHRKYSRRPDSNSNRWHSRPYIKSKVTIIHDTDPRINYFIHLYKLLTSVLVNGKTKLII